MSIGASTRWVLAHRRLVMVAWLLVAVVGLATGGKATGALSRQNTLPGQPAYQANLTIARRYGGGGVNPIVPVVTLPAGTIVDSPGVRAQLARVFGRATAAVPGARVASLVSTGDRAFISADGRTTFALLYPPVGSGWTPPPRRSTPSRPRLPVPAWPARPSTSPAWTRSATPAAAATAPGCWR